MDDISKEKKLHCQVVIFLEKSIVTKMKITTSSCLNNSTSAIFFFESKKDLYFNIYQF